MDYIKGSAYKASVLEMTSAGINQSHPAFRHAFTKASEHDEATKITAQVDKRLVSVRRNIARITAAVNAHHELASELKGYRRYLSSGFLDAFADDAERLYQEEVALECAEEEISKYLPEDAPYAEEENELLVRWQLERAPAVNKSPIASIATWEDRGFSPKSPPGDQNDEPEYIVRP